MNYFSDVKLLSREKHGVIVRLIPPSTAEFLIFPPKPTLSLFAHHRVGTAVNRESKSNLINEITYLSFGL